MCVDCGNNSCSGNCNVIPKGLRGPRGYKGDQGDKGEKGDRGITGSQGPEGSSGNNGPQGIPGNSGTMGPTGPQGPPGNPGLPGTNGINGTNGIQGIQGLTGSTGPQGEAGTNGDSVVVEASASIGACGGYNLKTISGLNGTVTQNSPVYNGCDGKSGRGVAVFVRATAPTNAILASDYAGIRGFTAPDYIVDGAYDASHIRPGDIWIKP